MSFDRSSRRSRVIATWISPSLIFWILDSDESSAARFKSLGFQDSPMRYNDEFIQTGGQSLTNMEKILSTLFRFIAIGIEAFLLMSVASERAFSSASSSRTAASIRSTAVSKK